MKQLLLAAALALAACSTPKPAPSADAQAAPAASQEPRNVDAELTAVEKALAEAGTTGTQAGTDRKSVV